MLTMKKVTRLFFLVIILALIVHGLMLLFLFGSKLMSIKKSPLKIEKPQLPKPVTIEPIKPLDLPNMLPGQQDLPNPPIPVEPNLDKPDNPEQVDQSQDLITKNDALGSNASKANPGTKPSRAKKRPYLPKPTFNFNQINDYAIAEGNSLFKNKGENRPPTKEDLAILMYQERARKHFGISLNRYADQANFYNVNRAIIDLIIVINSKGQVIDIRMRNHSNNPAIVHLIEKIVKYAGLFPVIPDSIKMTSFTLSTTITISQGKLTSGYGWQ